jgi:hypothetical protein
VKEALHARDLKPGDRIRFENRVWRVAGQFFEPPNVVDLDLFCPDDFLNLHVGAGDLFELVT